MLVNDIINSLRDTPDVWKFQPNIYDNYVHVGETIKVIPASSKVVVADRGTVSLGFWEARRVRKAVRQWQMRSLTIREKNDD